MRDHADMGLEVVAIVAGESEARFANLHPRDCSTGQIGNLLESIYVHASKASTRTRSSDGCAHRQIGTFRQVDHGPVRTRGPAHQPHIVHQRDNMSTFLG